MSNIVYLLGAGASCGNKNREIIQNNNDRQLTKTNITIKEGLPLVTDIPSHLEFIIDIISNYKNPENSENLLFPIGNISGIGYNNAKNLIIKDFEWLKKECNNHATIDTFAKKLYLKNDLKNFYKVESLLSIFFILEQIIIKKDGRYDTFLASVLDSNLNIDNRISILTWNYDSQFELAYKEYGENKDYQSIRNKLGIVDLKVHENNTRTQIFKLNGTANFANSKILNNYSAINDLLFIDIFNNYVKSRMSNYNDSQISFAWDNEKYLNTNYKESIRKTICDAQTLVIIGYTFPFFNRKIDRMIFDYMPNLNKIYIQDPNANQIIQNLEPIYSLKNINRDTLRKNVIPITYTDQFYLPPEL